MPISKSEIEGQYFDMVNETNIVSKTDLYGYITYVNKKFIEISGYSKEELLNQPHNMIRDPDTSSEVFKDLWDTIQANKVWKGVITNIKKDGSKYIVNSSVFPITNTVGEIVEYIAIRHDITEIKYLETKIEKLHLYNIEQENIARKKLEAGIINNMTAKECQVLSFPSDILSGDFYSIYKRKDGSTFVYLMDGQGHGVSPALTVFAISSMINQIIYSTESLEIMMQNLAPEVKKFLGDEEQLSYTIMMICSESKKLFYASAGMYPTLLKKNDEILKIKANNTPFMNFSQMPMISEFDIEGWDSLFMYSDGMVEHENENMAHFLPESLIREGELIPEAIEEIKKNEFDDDVTFIYLKNNTNIEKENA